MGGILLICIYFVLNYNFTVKVEENVCFNIFINFEKVMYANVNYHPNESIFCELNLCINLVKTFCPNMIVLNQLTVISSLYSVFVSTMIRKVLLI